jgi:hypothetical protein
MRDQRLLETQEYSHLPNNGAADLIYFSGKKHLPTRFIMCSIKCYILPTVLLGPT